MICSCRNRYPTNRWENSTFFWKKWKTNNQRLIGTHQIIASTLTQQFLEETRIYVREIGRIHTKINSANIWHLLQRLRETEIAYMKAEASSEYLFASESVRRCPMEVRRSLVVVGYSCIADVTSYICFNDWQRSEKIWRRCETRN